MVPAGGVADDGYRKGVSGEGVWGGGAGGGSPTERKEAAD